MNVIHMNAYFGTSRLYEELYRAIEGCGHHRQHILVPEYAHANSQECSRPGHVCHRVRLFSKHHRLFFPLKARCYTTYCQTKHQQLFSQADVIHAHTLFTDGTPAYRLSQTYRKPFIVAVRCTDLDVFYRYFPWWRRYAWNTLLAATYIITLSDTYRERLLKQLPASIARNIAGKMRVIPNGIREDLFGGQVQIQPRQHEGRTTDRINLLYVGTFIRRKNLPVLIRAAKLLWDKGQLRELRIIGGSGDRTKGIPGVSRNQPGYIRILDRMPRHELIPQYQWADVFAMPSMHETFGLVYAEALSQGTPVVCTTGEGFSDWIRKDVTGVAVDNPRRASEVADAIVRIATHGESAACIAAATRFRWASIAREYAELYTSAHNHTR